MHFTRSKIARLSLLVAIIAVLAVANVFYFGAGSSVRSVHASEPKFTALQKRLMSGLVSSEIYPQAQLKASAVNHNYTPYPGDDQCSLRKGLDIKVNQNCETLSDTDLQGRGQANNETSIAINQNDPRHIVASDNDYRRGDGNCYTAYSNNLGAQWNDVTVPMSFTRGAAFGKAPRQYWQAGGDTSVAWDTKGNAYLTCQVFNRGAAVTTNPDQSSAVYVFRSTKNGGASWNFPGRPVIEYYDPTGTSGVLEDKPLMTVDNHNGSPFQDRVYVSYTEFAADGTAYIWESYSNDYGEHFSPRALVSTTSPLCTNTYGLPTPQGPCNGNQFSQPFTGPDGALYIVYVNINNSILTSAPGPDAVTQGATPTPAPASDNRYQMLLSKSTDGGATFSTPVKVSDYYDLPDCATYQGGQDPGRACVPEKGNTTNSVFRATNYPSGSVNPRDKNQVVVTFGSYINKHSNEANGCVPTGFSVAGINLYTGVKTPGACNNDILISTSNDGGKTFTGTNTDPRKLDSVNNSHAQATTDQFWQWTSFSSKGELAVSYYDRQYGSDETNGFSDVSLSGSRGEKVTDFVTKRATSGSMPPPTQFSGLFYGDYTGLDTIGDFAYPIWMDTRDPELFLCPGTAAPGTPPSICTISAPQASVANDQDIFVTALPIL